MRSFAGRVAVITGAASGIGRGLAGELARRGCHLALADVDEAGLRETARELPAGGGGVSLHRVDVADRARMEALPDEVVRAHGRVHILVNNAGVAVVDTVRDHSLEDFEWIVGVNFWGVVHGCKFFLPHLLREDEGHIVNLSSMFGFLGLPTQGAYCATKHAVRALSETLFAELSHTSVGVTCVHPGGVRTNIARSSRASDPRLKERAVEQFDRLSMTPERAARRIVRAIERRSPRLIICAESRVAELAKRLFPVWTQRIVAWGYRRSLAGGTGA